MGSFNFSIQDSLTVGLTNQYYTDEEIEQYAQENEIDTGTAQFILIDYAKRAGLGITAGGWTGSTQYHQINEVWEAYKQGADAELLAQWERINNHNGGTYGN